MKRKCETALTELPQMDGGVIIIWCPKMGDHRTRINGQIFHLCVDHHRQFTAAQN